MQIIKAALITGFALLVFAQGVKAQQLPDYPFVFVYGKAKKEVPPDMGSITFNIEAFHENPSNAFETVRQRSATLVSILEDLKIPKQNIEAYEIEKKTVRETKDNTELKILGYEVNRRFEVTLHSLEPFDAFLQKLLSVENVTDIHASFDRTDRKAIEAELVAQACADARIQAEQMVHGVGAELGAVSAISQDTLQGIQGRFYSEASRYMRHIMMNGGKELLFLPSSITIDKQVNIIFKIQPK